MESIRFNSCIMNNIIKKLNRISINIKFMPYTSSLFPMLIMNLFNNSKIRFKNDFMILIDLAGTTHVAFESKS